MSAKILVILMLILIVGSLFSALAFLFRSKGSDDRTAKALTLRISLSLFLFLMLMAGYYFGFIPKQGL
jgi:uncharacterized BrkB/YihY/UPF0761 family membrane protein